MLTFIILILAVSRLMDEIKAIDLPEVFGSEL